jgi:hypothetical protein
MLAPIGRQARHDGGEEGVALHPSGERVAQHEDGALLDVGRRSSPPPPPAASPRGLRRACSSSSPSPAGASSEARSRASTSAERVRPLARAASSICRHSSRLSDSEV